VEKQHRFKHEVMAHLLIDLCDVDGQLMPQLARKLGYAVRAMQIFNEDDYQNQLMDIRTMLGLKAQRTGEVIR